MAEKLFVLLYHFYSLSNSFYCKTTTTLKQENEYVQIFSSPKENGILNKIKK